MFLGIVCTQSHLILAACMRFFFLGECMYPISRFHGFWLGLGVRKKFPGSQEDIWKSVQRSSVSTGPDLKVIFIIKTFYIRQRGVFVPDFKSLSFLVWLRGMTQTYPHINQGKLIKACANGIGPGGQEKCENTLKTAVFQFLRPFGSPPLPKKTVCVLNYKSLSFFCLVRE